VQDSGELPFRPNPIEPLLAYKVIYNFWMTYQPRIVDYFAFNWLFDHHNITTPITDDVSCELPDDLRRGRHRGWSDGHSLFP
jgi:hypothetical protein